MQARSIDQIESGMENEMSNEPNDKQYSKFLTYLKNHDTNFDTDDSSSDSIENVTPLSKRNFFLFPSRRSSQPRYRPIYSYGRKSHWDTFFG